MQFSGTRETLAKYQSIVCDSKNLGMKIMEDTGKARLIHEDIWIHTRETDTILGTIGLQ